MISERMLSHFLSLETAQIYWDPVVASDGYTYERKIIEEAFTKTGSSPRTKEKLKSDLLNPNLPQLYPNLLVRDLIEQYLKAYPQLYSNPGVYHHIQALFDAIKSLNFSEATKLLLQAPSQLLSKKITVPPNNTLSEQLLNALDSAPFNLLLAHGNNLKIDEEKFKVLRQLIQKRIKESANDSEVNNSKEEENEDKKKNHNNFSPDLDCAKCAFTISIVMDPGTLQEGHTFEISQLKQLKDKKNPKTRKTFTDADIVPNHLAYEIITTLLVENKIPKLDLDENIVRIAFINDNYERILAFIEHDIIKLDDSISQEKTYLHWLCYSKIKLTEVAIELLAKKLTAIKLNQAVDEKGNSFLHLAIYHNQTSLITALIKAEADVNLPNNDGDTPLHIALKRIKHPYSEVISLLLETNKINKSAVNTNGDSFLHLSVTNFSRFKYFMLLGVNPFLANKQGKKPLELLSSEDRKKAGQTIQHLADCLIEAIQDSNFEDVTSLISKYPFLLNHPLNDSKDTALYLAINNEKLLDLLLKHKADANIKNANGDLPLHLAVIKGNLPAVKLLSEYTNLNIVDQFGWSLLGRAVHHNRKDIIKFFIKEKNIDINQIINGDYALSLAILKQDIDLVQYLLDLGANINLINPNTQVSLLHTATRLENQPLVSFLLKNGINLNTKDANGATAIHIAVLKHNLELVKLLQESGENINATLNATNSDGFSPLCIAVARHKKEFIENLIKLGAKVDIKDTINNNLLQIAINHRDSEDIPIIEYLLNQKEIDINHINNHGQTPLIIAINKNYMETAKLLILRGANPDAKADAFINEAAKKLHQQLYQELIEKIKNELISAIKKGNLSEVQEQIKRYPQLLKLTYGAIESSLLQTAIRYSKDLKLIQWLIDNFKEQLLINDQNGNNTLHIAVMANGNTAIIKKLLDAGVNLYQPNNEGYAPLFYLTLHNSERLSELKALNKDYINLYKPLDTEGNCLWHLAAANPQALLYKILSEIDANPKFDQARNALGNTPLHTAIIFKNTDFVNIVLSKNVDLLNLKNNAGKTALHLAIESANQELVLALLKNEHTDPSLRDNSGKTALHLAVENRLTAIIDPLLRGNIAVNAVDKDGNTALHLANTDASIIEKLLFHGANPYIKNKNKKAPIKTLALANFILNIKNVLATQVLYSQFSEIKTYFKLYNYIFGYLFEITWPDTQKLNIENFIIALIQDNSEPKFNINMRDVKNGKTLLHYAAHSYWKNLITLLLQQDAIEIDAQDYQGSTALHIAVLIGDLPMVKTLLLNQAKLSLKDQKYNTPENLAAIKKDTNATYNKIYELLKYITQENIVYKLTDVDKISTSNILKFLDHVNSISTSKSFTFFSKASELSVWVEKNKSTCSSLLKSEQLDDSQIKLVKKLYREVIMLAYIEIACDPKDNIAKQVIETHEDNMQYFQQLAKEQFSANF